MHTYIVAAAKSKLKESLYKYIATKRERSLKSQGTNLDVIFNDVRSTVTSHTQFTMCSTPNLFFLLDLSIEISPVLMTFSNHQSNFLSPVVILCTTRFSIQFPTFFLQIKFVHFLLIVEGTCSLSVELFL
jgi:hypothetical protein